MNHVSPSTDQLKIQEQPHINKVSNLVVRCGGAFVEVDPHKQEKHAVITTVLSMKDGGTRDDVHRVLTSNGWDIPAGSVSAYLSTAVKEGIIGVHPDKKMIQGSQRMVSWTVYVSIPEMNRLHKFDERNEIAFKQLVDLIGPKRAKRMLKSMSNK